MAGNFLMLACPDCENEQVIFEKASTEVACAVCGHTLAHPTGGIADIEGEVIGVTEDRSTDALA